MRARILIAALALITPCVVGAQDVFHVLRETKLLAEPKRTAAPVAVLKKGASVAVAAGAAKNGFRQATAGGVQGWVSTKVLSTGDGASAASHGAAAAQPAAGSKHLAIGTPRGSYLIEHSGYVSCVEARTRTPIWVQYQLRPEDLNGSVSRDGRGFRSDTGVTFVQARARDEDYEGSGLDRGHMAPAEDMTASETRMSESFMLSNAVPQDATLNRGQWARLEGQVRDWVEARGPLTIICGPVFYDPVNAADGTIEYSVIGDRRVARPPGVFKVIVDLNDAASPQVLAFLFPNDDPQGKDWPQFQTTVAEIERLTGMDLLSALPATAQRNIEGAKAAIWPR